MLKLMKRQYKFPRMLLSTGAAAVMVLSSISSWAQDREIPFGPEFEFTASKLRHIPPLLEFLRTRYILPGPVEQKGILDFLKVVQRKCVTVDCTTQQIPGKYDESGAFTYRVTFADGWYFDITPDAWTVEITAKPQTIREMQSRRDLMNNFIFSSAKEIGLDPQSVPFFGLFGKPAGHVNFGTRAAFGESGRAWLRYFVDYANHPEFASGAIQRDFINAPPISSLLDEQRSALRAIVNKLNYSNDQAVGDVARRLIKEVYTHTPVIGVEPEHYQAFGVKHVAKLAEELENDRPSEHRAAQNQNSADDFIMIAEVIQTRVRFLEMQGDEPIVFLGSSRTKFTPKQLVGSFYVFIEEMGLPFYKYKKLLKPSLQDVAVDAFLDESRWGQPESYRGVLAHLARLPTSKYLRAKLLRYLSASSTTHDHPDVWGEIMKYAQDATLDVSVRRAYVRFLVELKSKPLYRRTVVPQELMQLITTEPQRLLFETRVRSCSQVLRVF